MKAELKNYVIQDGGLGIEYPGLPLRNNNNPTEKVCPVEDCGCIMEDVRLPVCLYHWKLVPKHCKVTMQNVRNDKTMFDEVWQGAVWHAEWEEQHGSAFKAAEEAAKMVKMAAKKLARKATGADGIELV